MVKPEGRKAMAKQRAPIEFNSISGGIITEASPLTFPDSASLSESNFELSKEGTRRRRLGFELETGGVLTDIPTNYSAVSPDTVNTFLWRNVGGRGDVELTVVQVGGHIRFYGASQTSLSAGLLGSTISILNTGSTLFSFASVDGDLAVATGKQFIYLITPVFSTSNAIVAFRLKESRLTIRDLFGIQVLYNRAVEGDTPEASDYIDITLPEYVTKRPMLEGLPNETSLATVVGVSTSETDSWTTSRSAGAGGSHDARIVTTWYGARESKQTFSPASFYGHEIVTIATLEEQWYTYSGTPFGGTADNKALIIFDTQPEFDSFTVTEISTGVVYTFTKDEGYGKTFSSSVVNPWRDNVGGGLNLELSVELTSVSSTLYNYNLRNQTFGAKRLSKSGTEAEDTVASFYALENKLPSMSDTVLSALYPNIDASNKTVDRFHAEDLLVNPLGSAPAPKGHFIIDALDRSESRKQRWQELADTEGYDAEVVALPVDRTPGGPRTVAEYGGRLWYGGFSEDGSDTEVGGLRLESYILYSQLANSKSVLTRCYQKGDPTSPEAPELLDTDGGFISLDGAYGVSSLIPLGNSLLAFCANGVWAVSGSDGNYFTPTAPRVQLVTSKGSVSPRAIVVIDSVVMYWSRDGIYMIAQSELGDYKVESLTEKTIQSYYLDIPLQVSAKAFGEYDPFTSKVSWYVYNTTSRTEPTQVLTLLTTTGAFTTHTISEGVLDRTLVGPAEVSPFELGSATFNVVVGYDQVVVGTDTVVTDKVSSIARTLSVKGVYLERGEDGLAKLGFGEFSNQYFKDWGEVDAPAHIITGYVSGGDFQRYKKTPYITFHFEKTEGSFVCPVDAGGQSSCLVQAQWEWSDNVNSGRWGRTFQAYRFRRHYIPADLEDQFDNGFSTVVTKNKIRGKGKVLSLKLTTEEGKDCRIIGWSSIMEVNSHV